MTIQIVIPSPRRRICAQVDGIPETLSMPGSEYASIVSLRGYEASPPPIVLPDIFYRASIFGIPRIDPRQ